jgi:hypothetical protein
VLTGNARLLQSLIESDVVKKVNMESASRLASPPSIARGFIPYLTVFTCWWALAMLTLRVRIPWEAWQPVLHVFWGQALLVEKILPLNLLWLSRLFWLAISLLMAWGCGYLLERGKPEKDRYRWRRALVASIVVQALWLFLAMIYAPE